MLKIKVLNFNLYTSLNVFSKISGNIGISIAIGLLLELSVNYTIFNDTTHYVL